MRGSKYLAQLICVMGFIMIFLGSNTVLAASNTKEESEHFNKAYAYYSQDKFDLAIEEYSKAINLKPDFVEAYFNRGIAYKDKYKYSLAIADFTKVIELTPKNYTAYRLRGMVYYENWQFEQAIQDYDKALKINVFDFWSYYHKGVVCQRIGDNKEAIKCFEEFIKWVPNEQQYLTAINKAKQIVESFYAEKVKQTEKKSNAQNSERLVKTAIEQLSAGDASGALESCSLAIKLNEESAAAYDCRAAAYFSLSRFDEAITDSKRAIALAPKYAAAWNNNGKAYLGKGDYGNAIASLQKAVDLAPNVQQFIDDLASTKQQLLEDIKEKYPVGSKVQVIQWTHLLSDSRYGYAGIVKGYSNQEVELEICAFINVYEDIKKSPATGEQYLYKKSSIGSKAFISPIYITGSYNGPVESNSSGYASNTNTYNSGYQVVNQKNTSVFVYRDSADYRTFIIQFSISRIAEDNNFVTAVLYDKNGNVIKDLSRNTTGYRDTFNESFVSTYTDYLPIKVVVSFVKDNHEMAQTSVIFTEIGAYTLYVNK